MKRIIKEIGDKFRPYFVHIIVDGLISYTLWVVLFGFKLLTKKLEIEGVVGEAIRNIHSVGTILAFLVFAYLFITDVRRIHSLETRDEEKADEKHDQ